LRADATVNFAFRCFTPARFKAWLQLKSGNDCYSRLRGEKLIAQVPDVVLEAIANTLTEDEKAEGLLDKCLRWWCRGLTAQGAIKKVRVDADYPLQKIYLQQQQQRTFFYS
jgi:hypothetical protein